MEWFNCKVDDRSKLLEVPRELKHLMDMFSHFLLNLVWVYMHSIGVPTDDDLQQYPHFFLTSPDIQHASVLDHGITPALLEEIHQEADDSLLQDSMFDESGIFTDEWYRTWTFSGIHALQRLGSIVFHAHLNKSNPVEEDWKSLGPYFGWQSEQVIQNTYKVTSHFGGTKTMITPCQVKEFCFNSSRRNEPVATDTIFSDTLAINDRSTMAQLFVG